jgi:tryptophan 2,3-dioxygenase
LNRRFNQPTLADAFWELLGKNGFDVSDKDKRVAAIVEILTHPEDYHEIYMLQDLLIEHDQQILFWRSNHVIMVERMLGMKPGTGGSEGVGYLQKTLTKKFFPELWEARTHLQVQGPESKA